MLTTKPGKTVVLPVLAALMLCVALAGQAGRFDRGLDFLNALAPYAIAACLILALLGLRFSRMAVALSLLAALICLERAMPVFAADMRAGAAPSTQDGLTVMSFNAWHMQPHPASAAQAIIASGADIVLLQEAGRLLGAEKLTLEMSYPFQSKCRAGCDLAILSKLPVSDFRYRIKDRTGRQRGPRMIFADIAAGPNRRPLTVATIHVDRNAAEKGRSTDVAAMLAEVFALMPRQDLVIGGDFNMTPYSFAANRIDRVAYPIRRVSPTSATYPSKIAGLPALPLFPIDHIYAAPRWQASSVRLELGFGSDHRPIAIRLIETSDLPRSG